MSKIVTPLNDKEIKALKASDKPYTKSDGSGLQLLIKTDSIKPWEFIFKSPTLFKRGKTSFGTYPSTALAMARKIRSEYIEKIKNVIDPLQEKQLERELQKIQVTKSLNTFEKIAREILTKVQNEISEIHYNRTLNALKNDCFPQGEIMKKLILMVLLLISTQVFAKEVRVYATGSYDVVDRSLIKGSVRDYAKKQALLIAQQNAIEEAGTAIYSSVELNYNEGKEKSIAKIEAISAGVIKTRVLKSSFRNDTYLVNIEATIDVADVEAVFNKADKRLKKITKLQQENAKIASQIEKLTAKMTKILERSTGYTLNDKKMIFKQQDKLLAKYEKNVSQIKVRFKKGTLADLANAADGNLAYDELDALKREWDSEVTLPYMRAVSISIEDIKVRKKSPYEAEIDFTLVLKMPDFIPTLSSKYVSRVVGDEHKPCNMYNSCYQGYNKIFFKDNRLGNDMLNWINRYRAMTVQIRVGDRKYVTKPLVTVSGKNFYREHRLNPDKIGVDYFNKSISKTKRTIMNFPIKALKEVDRITAEMITIDFNYFTAEIRGPGYDLSAIASITNLQRGNNKLPIVLIDKGEVR